MSLAPVAWVGLAPDSTQNNRFAYLAGVWFALGLAAMIGAAIDRLRTAPRLTASALTALVVLLVGGYHLGSLAYQVWLWRTAAGLSRSVMAQMERYRGSGAPLLNIVNLPEHAAEGPWVLKGYAFRFYRNGQDMPPVRADRVLVRLTGGVETVAVLGPDAFGDHRPAAGQTEAVVTLRLTPMEP